MKIAELKLPEFAFLEGSEHEEPNILHMRMLIYHVRSASVLEIFDYDDVVLNEDVLSFTFINTGYSGIKERMIVALHYSATLDKDADRQVLIDQVLKPAAKWYCDYCDWEDLNVYTD